LQESLKPAREALLKALEGECGGEERQRLNTALAALGETDRRTYPSTVEDFNRIHGSDKIIHGFTEAYDAFFAPFKYKKAVVVEIGIGGHNLPGRGGQSLWMWRDYFPNARVVGIDIIDKSFVDEDRIKSYKVSQVDFDFWDRVIDEVGPPDIVIDDGSHYCDHQQRTFEYLLPRMTQGGVYAIEDVMSNYKGPFGGDPYLKGTAMPVSWFAENIHYVNSRVIGDDVLDKSALQSQIDVVAFYHSLVIVRKIREPKVNLDHEIRDARLSWDAYRAANPKTKDGYFDYAGKGEE